MCASTTVEELAAAAVGQPPRERDTPTALEQRTGLLAVLRGGLLDLLATGDEARVTAAVLAQLARLAG